MVQQLAGVERIGCALTVDSPPGTPSVPDCGWLFLEAWTVNRQFAFAVRFTSAEGQSAATPRVAFDVDTWATNRSHPYFGVIEASSVDEAWAIACRFVQSARPWRVSLDFGLSQVADGTLKCQNSDRHNWRIPWSVVGSGRSGLSGFDRRWTQHVFGTMIDHLSAWSGLGWTIGLGIHFDPEASVRQRHSITLTTYKARATREVRIYFPPPGTKARFSDSSFISLERDEVYCTSWDQAWRVATQMVLWLGPDHLELVNFAV
jgi:hypothetical protein